MKRTTRREALKGGAGLAAASVLGGWWLEAASAASPAVAAGFDAGTLQHLLPTVSHDRIRLKASFARALRDAPRLRVDGTTVTAQRSDTAGRFWRWDAAGLRPDRAQRLELLDGRGKRLAEPWSLKTFPAPSASPKRLRLLIFTCAGGNDILRGAGFRLFQPVRVRQRLLRRGLTFSPDAVIANGDHVYWDLESLPSAATMGASDVALKRVGKFSSDQPVFGTRNEQVLFKAAGPQILPLYGVDCRSVPTFFLTDDHDYFENDEGRDSGVTFPPPWWKLQLARATQRLYYPEFLPVTGQPAGLPWETGGGTRRGLSEFVGALRYGKLLEFLMYDVRRTMTMAGPTAVFVDPDVERWIRRRIAGSDATHVVNMPSNPMGWSAGKWGEWYPDVLGPDRRLTTSVAKPYWQSGWLTQHDRLMRAIGARRKGAPLVVGGDIHATSAGRVTRSGSVDLSDNPVELVLSGTLGTDDTAFPSAFRGTRPRPPAHLDMTEQIAPIEENGFMIADVTAEKIMLRFFRWNSKTQSESDIDGLAPFQTIEVPSVG